MVDTAIAALDAVRRSPQRECETCGGSGDRNGNLRAADPFGRCPACDGTGRRSPQVPPGEPPKGKPPSQRARVHGRSPQGEYPREEGDVIVIGPGCFAARDRSVLNWDGVNYVPQPSPQGEDHEDHEDPSEAELRALAIEGDRLLARSPQGEDHEAPNPWKCSGDPSGETHLGEDHEAFLRRTLAKTGWSDPMINGLLTDLRLYLSRCPSPEPRCGAMPHLRGGCSLPLGHEGDHYFPAWAIGPSPERNTEKLVEAATEASKAMRLHNRGGLSWMAFDAASARLDAALAEFSTTKEQ
jgi:hypothetical protein